MYVKFTCNQCVGKLSECQCLAKDIDILELSACNCSICHFSVWSWLKRLQNTATTEMTPDPTKNQAFDEKSSTTSSNTENGDLKVKSHKSSLSSNYSVEVEDNAGECGWLGFNPSCLRCCNNAKGFLVMYCLFVIVQGKTSSHHCFTFSQWAAFASIDVNHTDEFGQWVGCVVSCSLRRKVLCHVCWCGTIAPVWAHVAIAYFLRQLKIHWRITCAGVAMKIWVVKKLLTSVHKNNAIHVVFAAQPTLW